MEQRKKLSTVRKIKSNNSEAFFLAVRGIEVGIFAGLISVLYRWLLSLAENGLVSVLGFVRGNALRTVLWFLVLGLLGLFVALVNKIEPDACGSGIPQVNAEVKGRCSANWFSVILAKLVGGTTSVFAGLSLGREGPSVQLGGMAAKGVARITKADKTTEQRMISCGAGAGMAAAFNAPLAGVMFVMEEIQHSFDRNVLFMGIVSTAVADYVSKIFFGQDTVFNYKTVDFPLRYYWVLVIIGMVLGLSGVCYVAIMLKIQELYKKIDKIPSYVKMLFVFIISGAVGLVLPQVLCGGHSMVEFLIKERPDMLVLLGLLVAKFLFGAVCFASAAPGGTLYPLCVLGTYLGAFMGSIVFKITGLPDGLWEEFAVLGMAGFFASTVKSPITGIILAFELTGNMKNLLPIATVVLISYSVSNLLGGEAMYEALLARLGTRKTGNEYKYGSEKIIKSFVIPTGSGLEGKKIKEVEWGRHACIITVERGEESITPNGDVVLCSGDEMVFFVSQRHLARSEEHLENLFAEQYKPEI